MERERERWGGGGRQTEKEMDREGDRQTDRGGEMETEKGRE